MTDETAFVTFNVRAKTMKYVIGYPSPVRTVTWTSDTPAEKAKIAAYLLYLASCYKENLTNTIQPPSVWMAERAFAQTVVPTNTSQPFTLGYQGYVKVMLRSGVMFVLNVPTANGLRHETFVPEHDDMLYPIGNCLETMAMYYGADEPMVLFDFITAFREVGMIRRNPPARIID